MPQEHQDEITEAPREEDVMRDLDELLDKLQEMRELSSIEAITFNCDNIESAWSDLGSRSLGILGRSRPI